MAIETSYAPVSYTGNGVTTSFPFTFDIDADAEIVVTEVVIATGVETVKTLTTHYTISGQSVVAVTAPASTVRWVISRVTPRTQLVDYTAHDAFPAETHEAALDKVTKLVQEQLAELDRSLRQPDGDSSTIGRLPAVIDRASTYLGFDADGDPIALAAPTDTSLTTPFTETLLENSTATAFLADVYDNLTSITPPALDADAIMVRKASSGNWFRTPLSNLHIVQATLQTTVTGVAVTFTGIPSGVKRITVMLNGFSTSSTSGVLLKIGDTNGISSSGYVSSSSYTESAAAVAGNTSTAGFHIHSVAAANVLYGSIVLDLVNAATFTWACRGVLGLSNAAATIQLGGIKSLAAELTQLSLGSTNGSDTLDAGSVNISYEF